MHIYIIYYTSELTTISPFFIASKTSLTFSTVELLKFGFSDGIPMPSFLASNSNSFSYGASKIFNEKTKTGADTAKIEKALYPMMMQ